MKPRKVFTIKSDKVKFGSWVCLCLPRLRVPLTSFKLQAPFGGDWMLSRNLKGTFAYQHWWGSWSRKGLEKSQSRLGSVFMVPFGSVSRHCFCKMWIRPVLNVSSSHCSHGLLPSLLQCVTGEMPEFGPFPVISCLTLGQKYTNVILNEALHFQEVPMLINFHRTPADGEAELRKVAWWDRDVIRMPCEATSCSAPCSPCSMCCPAGVLWGTDLLFNRHEWGLVLCRFTFPVL